MSDILKPDLQDLPTIHNRISFLYLERCTLSRQDSAIAATDEHGTVCIPIASLSVLLLGPGTNISHRAIELIGDVGASIIWVGERGVRYYAHGRPLTHSSKLLIKQAKLVSNTRTRLDVARRMYKMRFTDEDVSKLTMQQLRGHEGARIRSIYRACSKKTGVIWNGREYDPNDYTSGNDINKALSAAHACLYGIVHSVIVALGCSAGLGFIHTGHERSFVYDIADLYKAKITIPLAFEVTAEHPTNIGTAVRHRVREVISNEKILERMVFDIRSLILGSLNDNPENNGEDLHLWDEKSKEVKAGKLYGINDE